MLVLHGLEGSSSAGYVAAVVRDAQRRRLRSVALNFRGCSGEHNRLPRAYHSGDTADALHVAELMRRRFGGPLYAIGFSLGGNVLLKLLAEVGRASPIEAAVGVSVPYDLAACARALDEGGGLIGIYRQRFLWTLERKALAKAALHPGSIDVARLRRAHGIVGFDDVVTAPLHGFAGADDYYRKSSCGPLLSGIAVPTLLLAAKDDPLVPVPIPAVAQAHPSITAITTAAGGHVGFVAGSMVRPRFWADAQALIFLDGAPPT